MKKLFSLLRTVLIMILGSYIFGLNSFKPNSIHFSNGLSEFQKNFDYFVVDQWGVLHDGKKPYPGSIEAMQKLKNARKYIVMLSNSSKRKSSSYSGLAKVGFESSFFDDVVTSGELTWKRVSDRNFPFLKEYSKDVPVGVFLIGNGDDDEQYLLDCKLQLSSPETACFALARGMFSIQSEDQKLEYSSADNLLGAIQPWLNRCKSRNIPLLVSNPDLHRPGSNDPMPGQIGQLYKNMGGEVHYVGKPYLDVYEKCFESFASIDPEFSRSRTCGVGDSLEHDILGAHRAGIASVWTSNGVHAHTIGTVEGSPEIPSVEKVNGLLRDIDVVPDYFIPNFSW